ncbi:hypothetical protein ACFVWR_00715 [Leifsonia sp. NPDC058292]|uniref:hypothetical protein n=1 Tax=Leifsonia sp. NPDC058292 TaxID=3346428 RepID=UPI0036D8D332
MKTIKTRNGVFLTGSELAEAVLRYAVALGNRHRVGLVDIPVLMADGAYGRASFTVGWMTETSTMTAPDEPEEMTEEDTVLGLYDKAANDGVITAHAFSADDIAESDLAVYLDPADTAI